MTLHIYLNVNCLGVDPAFCSSEVLFLNLYRSILESSVEVVTCMVAFYWIMRKEKKDFCCHSQMFVKSDLKKICCYKVIFILN